MRQLSVLLTSGLILSMTNNAVACSFAPGYEDFLIWPSTGKHYPKPPPPDIHVSKIRRGFAGGELSADCSDAGIIELQVPDDHVTGYRFEIIHGEFEDAVIPEGIIKPPLPQATTLRFVWLDGGHDRQEPINFVLRVYAVSSFGIESDPVFLTIQDPGFDRGW